MGTNIFASRSSFFATIVVIAVDASASIPLSFEDLIPVADQCSRTARIGLPHCGHESRAALSSDKYFHSVLKHCLALLESYDSSTAVTARSGVLVAVLGHCQALRCDPVTASVNDSCGRFRSSVPSTACQCLHSLSYLAQNSGCGYTVTALDSNQSTAGNSSLDQDQRHDRKVVFLQPHDRTVVFLSRAPFEIEKEQTISAKILGVKQTVHTKHYW